MDRYLKAKVDDVLSVALRLKPEDVNFQLTMTTKRCACEAYFVTYATVDFRTGETVDRVWYPPQHTCISHLPSL